MRIMPLPGFHVPLKKGLRPSKQKVKIIQSIVPVICATVELLRALARTTSNIDYFAPSLLNSLFSKREVHTRCVYGILKRKHLTVAFFNDNFVTSLVFKTVLHISQEKWWLRRNCLEHKNNCCDQINWVIYITLTLVLFFQENSFFLVIIRKR